MPIMLPPAEEGLWIGDSDIFLPGTGTSVPTGLEARLEYGGILLNDKNVLDRYVVRDISGLDDAEIRDVRMPYPGEHGDIALGALYGGRNIVITGFLESGNMAKLRDMQMSLRTAFLRIWEEDYLIFRTGDIYKDFMIGCRKTGFSMREAQPNLMYRRDFQVTLRASNPRWLSYMEVLNSDDTLTIPGNVFTGVKNNGNFPSLPRIRLGGGLTNPTVTNDTNGMQIAITGTIASGSYLEIDVAAKTVKDQLGANQFSKLAAGSDWLALEPGDNDISLSATGSSGTPYLYMWHRHTWM